MCLSIGVPWIKLPTVTPQRSAGIADPKKMHQSKALRHVGLLSLLRKSKDTPRAIKAANIKNNAK